MRLEIDSILSDISQFGQVRRVKIKELETTLMIQIENELIDLLDDHGFSVIEHQLNDWIVAVRGRDKLRVWFPPQVKKSNIGAYTVNFVLNDVKCAVAVLIKHRFANVEYNYLTLDYKQELLDQIDKLKSQLEELRKIETSDIDGSYLACRFDNAHGGSTTFETLGSCLTQLIDKSEE